MDPRHTALRRAFLLAHVEAWHAARHVHGPLVAPEPFALAIATADDDHAAWILRLASDHPLEVAIVGAPATPWSALDILSRALRRHPRCVVRREPSEADALASLTDGQEGGLVLATAAGSVPTPEAVSRAVALMSMRHDVDAHVFTSGSADDPSAPARHVLARRRWMIEQRIRGVADVMPALLESVAVDAETMTVDNLGRAAVRDGGETVWSADHGCTCDASNERERRVRAAFRMAEVRPPIVVGDDCPDGVERRAGGMWLVALDDDQSGSLDQRSTGGAQLVRNGRRIATAPLCVADGRLWLVLSGQDVELLCLGSRTDISVQLASDGEHERAETAQLLLSRDGGVAAVAAVSRSRPAARSA